MASQNSYEWQLPRPKKQRQAPASASASAESLTPLFIPDDIDAFYGTAPVTQTQREGHPTRPNIPAVHKTVQPNVGDASAASLPPSDIRMQIRRPFIPDDIDAYYGNPATQRPRQQLEASEHLRRPVLRKRCKGMQVLIPDDIEAFYRNKAPMGDRPAQAGATTISSPTAWTQDATTPPQGPRQRTAHRVLPRTASSRVVASAEENCLAMKSSDIASTAYPSLTGKQNCGADPDKAECFRCGQMIVASCIKQNGRLYHGWCVDPSQPWENLAPCEVPESMPNRCAGIERPWLWMQS